jgi:two-component system, response regulator YesN
MYRLIIVDDEEIIRNGLAGNVDWPSMGFDIHGLFEDGKDAIEFLSRHPVDVVLTDVRMYEVSGLELAQHISEHFPQTVVIILSGYREFEYAQNAIKYGVFDYLLKPVEKSQILDVFSRVRNALDRQGRGAGESSVVIAQSVEPARDEKLISAVLGGDTAELREHFQQWGRCAADMSEDAISHAASSLIEAICERMERLGIQPYEAGRGEMMLPNQNGRGQKSIIDRVESLLTEYCLYLSDKKSGDLEAVVTRAKQFIEKNLASDFSVDDIAHTVFLSASYFSRCFKAVTSENVIDFVIRCRMDRAIELIRLNMMTTAEIGEKVGYSDVKYFQRAFKKHTGYTVKEYRRIVQ